LRYITAALGVIVLAISVPTTPASARQLVKRPSPEEQKKLGDQEAKQILKKYKEVLDARATHFQEIGKRLVAALSDDDRKKWDFRFHVLDSEEINAFALPGGEMFMFTGLYKRMKTDDELAAVTGHEMTHVRKEHWAKAYVKAQERQLFGMGLIIITRGSRAAQVGASVFDTMVGTQYSRGEEDEADGGGFQNMVDAGYNPNGMLNMFDTLMKAAGNGGDRVTGDFLSDHPLTTTRIKHTQERIAKLGDGKVFPPLTPFDYVALAPPKPDKGEKDKTDKGDKTEATAKP
jgi:predicted Zn-dependent protease